MICFGVDIKATGEDPILLRCDIDNEPIPSIAGKDFDVVFAGEIIEHLFDPEHMLDEIRHVLKPGGHLILTTPNLAAWYNRVSLLFGYQPIFSSVGLRGTYGTLWPIHAESHLRLYTLPALRGLVESCGFKVVKTLGFGINISIGWGKKHPRLTWIANRVFRSVGLSSLLVMIAEKR
jgi:SAM-dependent methyltransferase